MPKKGTKWVRTLHICCFTTHQGEGVDRNGKRWRWDFSEMFGPTFLDHRGEPLTRQPMSERHPAWAPFNAWLAQQTDLGKHHTCCAVDR